MENIYEEQRKVKKNKDEKKCKFQFKIKFLTLSGSGQSVVQLFKPVWYPVRTTVKDQSAGWVPIIGTVLDMAGDAAAGGVKSVYLPVATRC